MELSTEIIGIFIKLYQNNRILLTENKEYTFDLVDAVLALAIKSPNTPSVISYLRFLSILCSCDDEAITENQNFICDILLDKYSKLITSTKVSYFFFKHF